ncbi:MAG: sulfite exporter TauE/SafE family protein [Sandaracinaceae bacterium]|nr:MAG: sulfite exporter TauE/SafE family protein [Sandaracinaceae bacterium]
MQTRRWIFFAWLAAFYVAWATLVLVGDLWPTVASHWPIAASMAAGSYFAGSTPMGGGTVGFPVLVLLFDQPASMGRNFGFAVQSIGMVSASIYILSHRVPIDWRTLRAALPAAALTTPLCAALIAPRVPSALATLVYSVIVASFGLMHLARIRTVAACTRRRPSEREGLRLGLVAGCAGGLVASMTGVGIDMLVYIGMVAYARVDMRVAIPTSVILMAFTSLVGVGSNVALGSVDRAVFDNWLAAAPIVALGAPLGSIVVTYLSREKTLLVTSVLCVAQLVWALVSEGITGLPLVATLSAVAALAGGFHVLFRAGARGARAASRVIPRP